MSPNQSHRISLFDIYELVVPPGLSCHPDGPPGQRVLFLSDEKERFVISFEEGMALLDMLPAVRIAEGPVHTAELSRCGKYIHLRRHSNKKGSFAFFHMEGEDDAGSPLYLSGQMIAEAGYQWSDGIEPVLLEIMDGVRLTAKGEPTMRRVGVFHR